MLEEICLCSCSETAIKSDLGSEGIVYMKLPGLDMGAGREIRSGLGRWPGLSIKEACISQVYSLIFDSQVLLNNNTINIFENLARQSFYRFGNIYGNKLELPIVGLWGSWRDPALCSCLLL